MSPGHAEGAAKPQFLPPVDAQVDKLAGAGVLGQAVIAQDQAKMVRADGVIGDDRRSMMKLSFDFHRALIQLFLR